MSVSIQSRPQLPGVARQIEGPALNVKQFTARGDPIASPNEAKPSPFEVGWSRFGSLDQLGTVVLFTRGSQLYGENDPASYLYKLTSGLARACRVTEEGRRQIIAFYAPGELFGFELGDDHTFTVEAVSNVRARMIKRSIIAAMEGENEDIAEELRFGLARELRRYQNHILRLGRSAQERVAGFLLEMAERLPDSAITGLPIPRQDIADHLGITIETVSRTLTQLKCASAIGPRGRRITIRSPNVLERFSSRCS
jgi:CRP/FNR family transcriptional regulator, nitrogen fixation regulation protein